MGFRFARAAEPGSRSVRGLSNNAPNRGAGGSPSVPQTQSPPPLSRPAILSRRTPQQQRQRCRRPPTRQSLARAGTQYARYRARRRSGGPRPPLLAPPRARAPTGWLGLAWLGRGTDALDFALASGATVMPVLVGVL
jgi:hypothetical protein